MKFLVSLKFMLIAALALGAGAPVAQRPKDSRIAVSTQLDRTAIWVGDVFQYSVKAVHDAAIEVVVDNLRKENLNLAPFLVRDVWVRQDNFGANKRITEITLRLTTYESGQGELKIPSFPLYYFTRTAAVRPASENAAESVPVPVTRIGLRSTLTADSLRPRDSREIRPVTRQHWLIPMVLGLLGLCWLAFQLLRRLWAKSHLDRPVKKRLGRRARLRLVRDFIKQAQAVGRNSAADQQRYYAEVSQFVRSYLNESLEIDAASMTAQEVESALGTLGQNGLGAPVKIILQRCEQVLYSPQGPQLGAEWRDDMQRELNRFAELARH
jgi:hypothetical protein